MASASGTGPSNRRLLLLPSSGTRRTSERMEVLLAEKRAALSLMRTAVTVLALPFAILIVVVAAISLPYLAAERLLLAAIPLIVLSLGLMGLGLFLLAQGFGQCRRLDHQLDILKDTIGHVVHDAQTNS